MTSEQSTQPDEVLGLLLRATDGEMYVISKEALDTFRLSDEQRAEVEAAPPAAPADDDVRGYQFGWALTELRLQGNMQSANQSLSMLSNVMRTQQSAQSAIIGNMR